jgi:hypothetical protein
VSAISTSTAIRRWRLGLIAIGLAILLLSGYILLTTVRTTAYIGVVEWFIAAIIVHDALVAPIVFAAGVAMRKAGRRIPLAVLAIVQGGLVVGAVFTIVLVPEILAQRNAHLFETLLPFDYVQNLGILWAGTLVLTAATVVGYLVVRRTRGRASRRLATLDGPLSAPADPGAPGSPRP